MSRPAKKAGASRQRKQPLANLDTRNMNTRAAEQVKGGAGTSAKPVARYHLENAWPSK